MTSKLNIFNSLPQHASDSEDEINPKNAKSRINKEKQDQRKDNQKGAHGHTAPRDANQKEDVSRQKTHQKQKVTAEPHPQDRQSGTGTQAYGGKAKKSGAGKGNWGNYKEDRKAGEEGEEVESPEVQEEEKPEGLTLQEYLASRNVATSGPQVNEAKSKITSEQLMKEVGKATLMNNRVKQTIDDKKAGKKKGNLDVDHHASINTEHSELLNFRTGFVEREYKERSRDGDNATQPRRFGGPRERREKEEPQGEAQPQTETTPAEGAAPTEATAEGAAPTEAKKEERRQGGQGQRGGQRGGYQKGGERRPYAGNKQTAAKVNFEDESAFPKLG